MSLTELYEALEVVFPPVVHQMPPPFGETKSYQFQAQIVSGEPQVFLTDPTEERVNQLQQVLASLQN